MTRISRIFALTRIFKVTSSLALALTASLTTSAMAHDVALKGEKAPAEVSKLVEAEFIKMMDALQKQGISPKIYNISIEPSAVIEHNCCTIITPDSMETICPCSE